MNKHNFFTFQKIISSHPQLPAIIALSMGSPTLKKVRQVIDLYETPCRYLVGSFEANTLVGIMGLEIQGKGGIIKHIAVLSGYRLQGVGKALIKYGLNHFSLQSIDVETDDDAVDFYRKLEFTCQPFEGHHGKRYTCDYK